MPDTEAKDVLSRAERIAREAHAGQKDWVNGEPYITHVERVVSMVSGEAAKSVAWLHDVLEDTAFERVNLVASSIPSNIIGAVEILTRVPPYDQHEHYDTYIGLIKYSGNTLATQVKLADLRDHLRPNCPERLRARYERAVKTLTDESDLRVQLTSALEAQQKAERERKKFIESQPSIPLPAWRCYHCDKVFNDPVLAAEHFGDNRNSPSPAACEGMLNAISQAFEQYGVHRNFHNAASVKQLAQQRDEARAEVQRLSLENAELRKDREREYFFRFPKSTDYCGPYRSIDEMREDSAWKHAEWVPVWRLKGIPPGPYHEFDREAAMNLPAQETPAELSGQSGKSLTE